ncbi:MAG: type II secretion system F family protein [Clostridia bacterium]|nr:type II secretion system F family protein [Clostridia bacterium]
MAGFLAIAASTLIFAVIVLLFGSKGARSDIVRKRVHDILSDDAQKAASYDEDLSKPIYERLVKPYITLLSTKIAKYMPKGRRADSENKKLRSDKQKKMLRQAGMSMSIEEYSLIRFFVLAGAALFFGLISVSLGLGSRAFLGVIFGVYAGYTVLRLNLTSSISKRRETMEQQMPDVLDLLSVNVEAGLGFEQALLQVIGHFEGPLIDELTVTYREITMGRVRREALALFAERCEIDEIKTFVGSIIQAEQLGISIKNVLRTQATAMRANRRSKVEEKAQKVQVKMLIPMVGLIFPVLLIVLLGPAVVQMIHVLR